MSNNDVLGVEILDCTLRDASYQIQFQFTAEDCMIIAAGLESSGIRMIEVGHGLGLGASSNRLGISAATDMEYIDAAASVLKEAKLGVFAIPGIVDIKAFEHVADKLDFIRVGVDANRIDELEEHIKEAKQYGLYVSANLMKSYLLEPGRLAECAEKTALWGADMVAVVDSAGCMLPSEVRSYVQTIMQNVDIATGFHGHNNLQLAVANSLSAIDGGATMIDTTLRGMGRSSGNAQTEVIALLLNKIESGHDFDTLRLFEIADRLIKPLSRGKGVEPVEALLGYSGLHSGYLPEIQKSAEKYGYDIRLMLNTIAEQGVRAEDDKFDWEQIIKTVTRAGVKKKTKVRLEKNVTDCINKTRNVAHTRDVLKGYIDSIYSICCKHDMLSVVTVSQSRKMAGDDYIFVAVPRIERDFVIAHIDITSVDQISEVSEVLSGNVDIILADRDRNEQGVKSIFDFINGIKGPGKVISYSDSEAQISSSEELIIQLADQLDSRKVAMLGADDFFMRLAWRLLTQGITLYVDIGLCKSKPWKEMLMIAKELSVDGRWGNVEYLEGDNYPDLVVGASRNTVSIDKDVARCLSNNHVVVDAGVGSVSKEAVELCLEENIPLHRIDVIDGLKGHIITALSTEETLKQRYGYGEIDGINIASGGAIAKEGTIVVDSVNVPSKIIGVADGESGILLHHNADKYQQNLMVVYNKILNSYLS